MSKVFVVAPHPDDETLGCGGTLLRHGAEGDDLYWLIVTEINEKNGYDKAQVSRREQELANVARAYGFKGVFQLKFPTTVLDTVPIGQLVEAIGNVFREGKPEIVYSIFEGDAHTDHGIVARAVAACTKWFRYPSIRRVLAYETISETDFALNVGTMPFRPTSFVDISAQVDRKVQIMKLYSTETGDHPFPRSERSIRALADLRGAAAGCESAESFMLLKEVR